MRRRLTILPLASFICGLLFGVGLLVSGMTQPAKVLGFLDVFGLWHDFGICDGRCPSGLIRWLSRRPAAGQAGTSCRALVADSHGYRPMLLVGSALFGGRLGIGWALPGAGACEPRKPDAASDGVRTCHGSGFGDQGPVGQVWGNWPRNKKLRL
jgi:hypothetical protein